MGGEQLYFAVCAAVAPVLAQPVAILLKTAEAAPQPHSIPSTFTREVNAFLSAAGLTTCDGLACGPNLVQNEVHQFLDGSVTRQPVKGDFPVLQ